MMTPRVPRIRALVALCVASSMSVGCAGLQPNSSHTARLAAQGSDGGFGFAVATTQTRFETETRAARSGDADPSADEEPRRVSPALFWTGVVLGTVGAITLGTGVGLGVATASDIRDGDAAGQSRATREDLERRGEVSNDVAITGGVLTILGLGLAAAVAGIDYSRCGPVIGKKRRSECEALTAGAGDVD